MEPKMTFTCISCRVVFDDVQGQRAHYQTPWHCFNLKRKLANLPPITLELFETKVAALKKQEEEEEKKNRRKRGKKSHKYRSKRPRGVNGNEIAGDEASTESEEVKSVSTTELTQEEEEEEEEELLERRLEEARALETNESLFDAQVSKSMEKNLKYMARHWGFFIPDIESVRDLEGLMGFLGQKVGLGYCCLYCEKEFGSVAAVKQHMIDKSHCKLNWDDAGDSYAEYYYDWEEEEEEEEQIVEVEQENLEDDEGSSNNQQELAIVTNNEESEFGVAAVDEIGELHLPNGRILGTRSLQRYYKQRRAPGDDRTSVILAKMAQQYKELGLVRSQKPTIPRTTRELKRKQRHDVRLGVKSNKLFVPRPQVDF